MTAASYSWTNAGLEKLIEYPDATRPQRTCHQRQGVIHLHHWWGGPNVCKNCGVPLATEVDQMSTWLASDHTWVIQEPEYDTR